MDINVASLNPQKVQAVEEVLQGYPYFHSSRVHAMRIDSGVGDQPQTLDDTMLGAKTRAYKAFHGCEYSIGLESGMIRTINSETGKMNLCACAIYDGSDFSFGLSPAFELPQDILDCVEKHKVEINEAVEMCGYVEKGANIGYKQGLIALLTQDKITRKDYMKPAIHFALIDLNKKIKRAGK